MDTTISSNINLSTQPDASQVKNSLPPFSQLLKDSWYLFTKSILQLFLLNVTLFIVGVLAFLAGIVLVYLSVTSSLGPDLTKLLNQIINDPMVLGSPKFIQPLMAAGAVFVFYILFSIILALISQISSIMILGNRNENLTFNNAIKKSIPLIIPWYLVSLMLWFLGLGSFFFFFIPAIIFSFFFMYAGYEVVLHNKRGREAIKGSIQIVSQHFGDIFVRHLVFFLAVLFIQYIIPGLLPKSDKNITSMFSVPYFLLSPFITWYGLSYGMTIYKQAKVLTDVKKKTSLVWYFIIALLGWLIFFVSVYGVYGLFKKAYKVKGFRGLLEQIIKDAEPQKTNILTYAPSACGLSIPIPNTTETKDGKTRKWYYEEISLTKDSFYILDRDVFPATVVLGAFIGFKDSQFQKGDETFNVNYPGMNIYCVDNDKSLTLEEFKSLALTNKTFKVTPQGKYKWGEVDLEHVWVEGDNNGKDMKDIAYLAVSKDGKRLMYIRLWGTDTKDSIKQQLDDDINTIVKNLKYRDTKEEIKNMKFDLYNSNSANQNTNSAPAAPSCTRYTIREGEFASDKCYGQKDYNDLVYYLGRFNSSVAFYNGAVSTMRITCNGSDFFKDSCERDKKQKETSEADMNKYRGIINGIIGRGS